MQQCLVILSLNFKIEKVKARSKRLEESELRQKEKEERLADPYQPPEAKGSEVGTEIADF